MAVAKSIVSIWTTTGREKMRFECGARKRRQLAWRLGASDLVTFRGRYYLLVECGIEEPSRRDFESILGIAVAGL